MPAGRIKLLKLIRKLSAVFLLLIAFYSFYIIFYNYDHINDENPFIQAIARSEMGRAISLLGNYGVLMLILIGILSLVIYLKERKLDRK